MIAGITEAELAATVHARFAAQIRGGFEPAPAEARDDGTVCPTCEGDCTVPACTDPACGCEMDPPCAERACPDCGGLGSV